MTSWDEIRTAFQVARLGTVSAAAEVLGVHHATVIRHIDALEARLGVRLFQRHSRGYTPTEAGRDLLRVAEATDDQFAQLAGRLRGQDEGPTGELVVTSLVTMSRHLTPVLAEFQALHPALLVRYLTGDRLFRLEYGEAHVAVRAGPVPEQPDNVVQPFVAMRFSLVASEAYVARHGMPVEGDLARHRLIGLDDADGRAPINGWMAALAPRDSVTWRVSDTAALLDAVVAGAGLGFVALIDSQGIPGLRQVLPPRDEWVAPSWIVTHVDLHRTTKVQAFLALLKERARGWSC